MRVTIWLDIRSTAHMLPTSSSLNERSHKCFKSGDAHLYLLQDNCEIGIKEKQ